MNEIFDKINIKEWYIPFNHVDHDDLNLNDPYSKISCFIIQLYSMELGSPALYSEVNKVSRGMDFTLLKELGPFILALSTITLAGEENKKYGD